MSIHYINLDSHLLSVGVLVVRTQLFDALLQSSVAKRANVLTHSGKFIIAGTLDGRVCVYDVETSQWDHRMLAGTSAGSTTPVCALLWTRMRIKHNGLHDLLRPCAILRPTLQILPPEGMPYSYPPLEDEATIAFADADATLRDAAEAIQLLCVANASGTIALTMGTSLPLGSLQAARFGAAVGLACSADWSLLAGIFNDPTAALVLFDTAPLPRFAPALHEVSSLKLYLFMLLLQGRCICVLVYVGCH